MSKVPVVFIIDDDLAFAESLSKIVATMGFESHCFDSPIEFSNQFDSEVPGVLLLADRMSDMSGLSVLERLNSRPLRPAVIFLTAHPDIHSALQAMRHGAIDYLQKSCSEAELYEAIQRGFAHDAANRAVYTQRRETALRFAKLNQPEKEVLEYVLKGMVNKQIATLLGISRRTVEDRRARIVRKLGVESFAQLVALATVAGFQQESAPASMKAS